MLAYQYSCTKTAIGNKLILNKGWKFKSTTDSLWLTAEVPGSVHTDLLRNGIIKDPFYRLNEHDVQWVDKKNWEYKTTFSVSREILGNEKIELEFKGLDTYATVFLNNKKILEADNMFMNWLVECKNQIKEGGNDLRIVFESPISRGLEKREVLGYFLPGAENDQSETGGLGDKKVCVFSRKAQYHFGWDWGPRLVTSGIWQDITLKYWNNCKINDLFIKQDSIGGNRAGLTAEIDIESTNDQQLELIIKIDDELILKNKTRLLKGTNRIEIPFDILNPELWWTNGLGKQKLYKVDVGIIKNNREIANAESKTGLRTIGLIRKKDSIGESFYFRLNGRPVFMKGANYIPQDVFLNRVKPADYERLIRSAAEANFNMLRVWGGGIYEKEVFYDLCDKYGILVWQDFMFACAMYPGNTEFLNNVKAEAEQNVKRLRKHTCIALWCGDNEILSAWNNWGWKEDVAENQGDVIAEKVWGNYDTIVHHILPEVIEKLSPHISYWSSSPSAGIGKLENGKSGDMHYWGVWWAKEPFANYKTKIPRFMSEYGFQSFPEINSINKYAIEEDWDISSEVMKSHQRSSIGNATIEEYMDRDYRKPKDFPMFVYVNHLLQAEGVKTAIEAHRRNMPICMGSLYWQLNDCWPAASWSGIDYYGQWKALHYFAKKAFGNILVSPDIDSLGNIAIFGINDLSKDKKASLIIEIIDFDGNKKWGYNKNIILRSNSSAILFQENIKKFCADIDKQNTLLHCELINEEGGELSENILYFDKTKNLGLPRGNVGISCSYAEGRIKIDIRSGKLVKNIYLKLDDDRARFSDNYFDMLPGQKTTVYYVGNKNIKIEDFINGLTVTDLSGPTKIHF